MRQTTVQEFNTIRFGSGMFEVEDAVGGWHDLGAMRDIQFEETWDKIEVLSDNAGPIVMGIRNHRAALSGSLMEINLEKLNILRGGLDEYDTVAAAPVNVADEIVTLTGTTAVRLSNKNGDNTEVGSIVVRTESGGGGVLRVRNTDYVISVDGSGYTTIARIVGGAIGSGDSVFVSYEYTPAAGKTLSSGGRQTLDARAVRVTNTNEAGDTFVITVHKATTEEGIVIDFQGDHEEDPAMVPINMVGTMDESKAVGEQLFEIVDSQ